MRWAIAGILALTACLPPSSTPPHQVVSRVVVRVDTEVEGMPPLDQCARLCPPASTRDTLAYCHAAEVPADLLERRRSLGEQVTERALVCAYGPEAR